jgi:glycosyltransferase involved in cell wall biosynthesis
MLREAVASVTRLQRPDVELIVVDDGSTEEATLAEMRLLSSQGINVFRQENKGLGSARNAGIRMARGEFILPLDSDNHVRECYFVAGVEVLKKHPTVGVVYGNVQHFGEKSAIWQLQEFDLLRLTKANFIDACALYRKTVWESIQGYDEKMPWMGFEDWDFWLRAAVCGWGFAHLNEIAFDYRVRSGSMLETTNRHTEELLAYIFGKPQNQAAKLIRQMGLEFIPLRQRVRQLENSRDYRLGRLLVEPLRRIKRICWRQ